MQQLGVGLLLVEIEQLCPQRQLFRVLKIHQIKNKRSRHNHLIFI